MKQNEKKKRVISALFAALVVLTLISCCFLGTTFARYSSSSSGGASVEVANWDVNFSPEESSNITFGEISPSETGYGSGTQTNTIAGQNIVVITNSGEVEADVTVTVGSLSYSFVGGASFGSQAATWSDGKLSGAPTQAQVESILALTVSVSGSGTTVSGNGPYTATLAAESSATQSITVSASVIWTTNYDDDSANSGAFVDALDTWIGENIASVSVTVTCSAVQGSQVNS